jgi:hypothetical protein
MVDPQKPSSPTRHCLLLITLTAVAISPAQARTDARRLTCAQAQTLIRQQGAAVLTTGQYTYERFVSDHRFCDGNKEARPARTPTRDDPSCRIGNVCQPRPDRD